MLELEPKARGVKAPPPVFKECLEKIADYWKISPSMREGRIISRRRQKTMSMSPTTQSIIARYSVS